MAQLGGESAKMWEELRSRAVVEYIQGTWQCLLEHQTNQRFYYDSSTGAHQWEPPSLAGEGQDVDDVGDHGQDCGAGGVGYGHEVRGVL